MAARIADATRDWQPGDACRSYDGRSETTVAKVENGIATLANGDVCHVSKIRRAQ